MNQQNLNELRFWMQENPNEEFWLASPDIFELSAQCASVAFGGFKYVWQSDTIEGILGEVCFWVAFAQAGCPRCFYVGEEDPEGYACEVACNAGIWSCEPSPNNLHNEFMARGLYRLGFEDESILSQLPDISAHEKLELRLSMPREFWPQKWLDEVGD